MKITIVTMEFPSPREVFACNNLLCLKSKGHSIDVYSYYGKNKNHNSMVSDRKLEGIKIFTNNLLHFIYGILLVFRYIFKSLWLFSKLMTNWRNSPKMTFISILLIPRSIEIFHYIKEDKPDVVHAYWCHYPGMVTMLVSKFIPGIITSCGAIHYDIHTRFLGSLVYNSSDMVVSISNAYTKIISDRMTNPSRIITVYHGLLPEVLERKSNIPQNHLRFVSAGALMPHKRMDKVLHVFKEIQNKYPEASLVIIGDGPERGNLEKFVSDKSIQNVVFEGHIPHDIVIQEFEKAEYFLFLSALDNIPNVVKEAIACNCLCIVTNTIGMDELVLDNITGGVVEIDNTGQAVAKILKILNLDPAVKNQMIENARNHLLQNFNETINMDRYVAGWQNIRV